MSFTFGQRQDHPKALLGKAGHLFTDEGGVVLGGLMWPTAGHLFDLLHTPLFARHRDGDALRSYVRQEGCCRVGEVPYCGAEQGRAPIGLDKGFPRRRRMQQLHSRGHMLT